MKLSNQQARHLVLHLQGLTRAHHLAYPKDGLADMLDQLGFVQQDSIRWMERAHHMTLFSRNRTYRPKHLQKLHESGELFENWTHDASLIPSKFWKYWKHKFARDEIRLREKFTRWQGAGFEERVEGLRRRITDNGLLRARDLEKPKGQKLEMWQWHDGKAALEFMWRTGQLAVPKREGFQKTYDLSERVIPPRYYHETCSREEFVDWACRSALDRLGFGSARDIASYWDLLSLAEVKDWLEIHGQQETISVEVEPTDESAYKILFARPDIGSVLGELEAIPGILRVLSPFDPVVRDRKRMSWLFGFDYTIEIYVPPEQRQYGYYVFPLLDGDKLIGRLDAQARRADNCLHVTRLWLEPKTRWSNAKEDRLRSELARQMKLCCVSEMNFQPDWLDL